MTPDIHEVLRYLGAGAAAPETLRQQVYETADALAAQLQPRYVYRVFELTSTADGPCLPALGLTLPGRLAATMLADCSRAAILACTLGAQFDAMLLRQQARNMAQAVILDACGSAFVEGGCDAAEQELAARLPELYRTDRFSPGYGDLPLELQPQLCAAVDAERRLGLQVTQSLLLNPTKSVTAVIGLSDRPQMARIRGCGHCTMRDRCTIHKGGQTCGI